MSETIHLTAWQLANAVRYVKEAEAASLIATDRKAITSAARAEGEAAGYRRAVEEIAAWLDDAVFVRLSSFSTNQQSLGGSIRAKFGGQ